MASPLYEALGFMHDFGIFDVVLPFLLVFTVIFGVLEKTKIFGTENDKSRKNINAMVAFTIGFFVVAATQVVDLMQASLPYIIFILILIIAFMVLFGATVAEGELNIWEHIGERKGIFAFGLLIAIIAIIVGAMGMFGAIMDWIFKYIRGPAASTVILLVVIGIFIWVVIGGKEKSA
jgi:hypothetical protein